MRANSVAARKSVLVTGASSGIGQAIAERLASEGFEVFGTSRQQRSGSGRVQMLVLDVRTEGSVAACVDTVLSRAGRIDVLINNAGVMHEGFIEETSLDEAQAIFHTNFFGVARMTRAVLPHMRAQRRGLIINIGSLAAWMGEPREGYYAASKSALAAYTESLRHEVWPLGIDVSLVEPGAFTSNVLSASTVSEMHISDYDAVREVARETLHNAMQRGDDPDAVAAGISRIVTARAPRLRYTIGRERWLPYAKVLLPQRLIDRLVRRAYGLGKPIKPG